MPIDKAQSLCLLWNVERVIINQSRLRYQNSNATNLAMRVKLSIKNLIPIRPIFEVSELTMCKAFEQMIFVSHATSLQAVDHVSHVGITRQCFHEPNRQFIKRDIGDATGCTLLAMDYKA